MAVAALLSAAALAVTLLLIVKLLSHLRSWSARYRNNTVTATSDKDPYDAIEALPAFDWASTPPIRIRPFKPKYHMTMGNPEL